MNEEKEDINFEDIFLQLGFSKVDSDYVFDFGNCKLKVIEGFNQSMSYGYNLFGISMTHREGVFIEFSVPIKVESFEMGVALLSNNLKTYRFLNTPDWIQQGIEWKNHLPWVKARLAYEAIPKAEIDREWFKLLNKELRIAVSSANEHELFNFSFDGEIFKIVGNNFIVSCAAKGTKWENAVAIRACNIKNLPSRITIRSVFVYVNKDKLRYDRNEFQI